MMKMNMNTKTDLISNIMRIIRITMFILSVFSVSRVLIFLINFLCRNYDDDDYDYCHPAFYDPDFSD